uniref:Probable membrane protein ycbW n=1 Tax=Rheinheimera sp. BAL341 TaxID=1708203 RepID=A0A486XKD7_9GAMM
MFKPSERWCWHYCPDKDRLLLDISAQAQFCSPFRAAQLLQQPCHQALSMAEAEAFWAIDDSLAQLGLPAELQLELSLTALSAAYLQLQAHKSWYFQQGALCNAKQYDIVTLRGLSTQYAIVLSAELDAVTCLLLDDMTTLAGKVLPRLQVVRVLRNRINPLDITVPYRHTA